MTDHLIMNQIDDIDDSPCRFTLYCPFFNDKMADMPAMASTMKIRFCEGNFATCARYVVLTQLGPKAVPGNLYPSSMEQARQILMCQECAE